jgi:hypothetical protein
VDSSVLIENERRKLWASNLTRLGSGAIAYVFADIYIHGEIAPALAFPLMAGLSLSYVGHMFLGLMQSER